MSGTTFVSSRLETIQNRFLEVETLLSLAKEHISEPNKYTTLCRSAHVLLVSHVEGIYKDIVKDVIDDLNFHTEFFNIKQPIFKTHALHFIHVNENDVNTEKIKQKLWSAFKIHKTELVLEPFLRSENKNPTPKIMEEILKKFGENTFFNSLIESKLEIVFENDRKASARELNRIKKYINAGVQRYPYAVDKTYFYNFNPPILGKDKKGVNSN